MLRNQRPRVQLQLQEGESGRSVSSMSEGSPELELGLAADVAGAGLLAQEVGTRMVWPSWIRSGLVMTGFADCRQTVVVPQEEAIRLSWSPVLTV